MIAAGQQAPSRVGLWSAGSVPYVQWGTASPTGHRPDCSGFVSMCWDLPTPGENTESLVTKQIMYQIPEGDLQPGDAIGLCGPGTLGNAGHIMLFLGSTSAGFRIAEQAGGTWGPTIRTIKRIPSGYLAYRLAIPEEFDVEVLRAENPSQGDIDAWRLDALTYGLDTVRGGPLAGEPMWIVQAIKALQASVANAGVGGGPSLAAIEAVVDRQLDEAFGAAAAA